MSGFPEFLPRNGHHQQQQQQQQQQQPYWSPQSMKGQQQPQFTAQASMSGMNSAASAWVPTKAGKVPGGRAGGSSSAGADSGAVAMVEVTVNGSTFFVPESMAAAAVGGGVGGIGGGGGGVGGVGGLGALGVGGGGGGVSGGAEGEEGNELDDGLSFWSNGSTTLPAPPKRSLKTIGIPDPIRQHFQSLDMEALKQMTPDDERYKEMPNRFHSAFALDDSFSQMQRGTGGSYGYPSSVYKVVDSSDSQSYALRRVDNVRTSATVVKNAAAKWSEIRHPAIVSLYSISQERGGVFFSHAYHPAAQTLRQRFIDQRGPFLSEALLWRILSQLLSGVRLVHLRQMALRNVSPTHVLLTSGTCARFSGVGVVDVLEFESRKNLAEMQVEDMMKLGYLILSLAARYMVGAKNVEQALALLSQHFSTDLNHVIGTLLVGKLSVSQVCHLMSQRIHDELDQSMAANDALQSHLRNEYENGRMLRLLLKLGFMNERPEYARAPQWSETGDRYVLKLFRDYVFHQGQEDGTPVLDVGHVISTLNKLDCGDSEKILLSSRDNKDLLVVSFADVRRCLEAAFTDLSSQSEHQQGGVAAGLMGRP